MAKCRNCEYPYATNKVCPNCGEKNPTGGGCFSILILIALVGGGLYLWNNNSNSNSINSELSNELPINANDDSTLVDIDTPSINNFTEDGNIGNMETEQKFSEVEAGPNLPPLLQSLMDEGGEYITEPKEGVLINGIYWYVDGEFYNPETGETKSWKVPMPKEDE